MLSINVAKGITPGLGYFLAGLSAGIWLVEHVSEVARAEKVDSRD